MTEDVKNRNINIGVRILLFSSVFLFGLSRHLFGWEEAAGSLLESHMVPSLEAAIILIHVTTIMELIFAIWVITAKLNKYFAFFGMLLATIYSVSFLTALGNESFVGADLTSIQGYMGYPLVVISIFISLFFLRNGSENKRWVPKWIVAVLMVAAPIGYLSYFSSTFSDFKYQGSSYNVKYAHWEPYWTILEEEHPEFIGKKEYVLCFFNTGCSHCNEAARLIGAYRMNYPNVELLGVFFGKSADDEFWSTETKIEEFLDRNNLDIPYIKMKDYEAVSISDNHFPVMIQMVNEKPSHIYVGMAINAWAFDHLFGAY